MSTKLTESDLSQLDWWARHYKDGVAYLSYRMVQYFEAKDSGDMDKAEQLEKIIRASLPAYREMVGK